MHQSVWSRISMAVRVIIAKLLRQFVIVMITLCLSSSSPLVSVQATGGPCGWLRVFLHCGQDTVIFPGNCETEISPLGTNYTVFMTLIDNTTACKVSVSGCIQHYTFWRYAMLCTWSRFPDPLQSKQLANCWFKDSSVSANLWSVQKANYQHLNPDRPPSLIYLDQEPNTI